MPGVAPCHRSRQRPAVCAAARADRLPGLQVSEVRFSVLAIFPALGTREGVKRVQAMLNQQTDGGSDGN